LPVYLQETSSTQTEIIQFNRTVIQNLSNRIGFFKQFSSQASKIIPVISSLLLSTGETNTLKFQFEQLKDIFPNIAIRTFINTIDNDISDILEFIRHDADFLIYDIDKIPITSPVIKKQKVHIDAVNARKIMVRSAINTDIQNVKLDHGEIVAEADNSLVELFDSRGFQSFGDYVGIKKDDLSSGGTISPGFIFFDPFDNLYYGYKGNIKSLDEFELTIVPAVLNSEIVQRLRVRYPQYLTDNLGFELLERIGNGQETGKSQAKFKKISMEHYLHCIKTSVENDQKLPLSQI
jgi:hypothetical protein